jgi:hypothetical protein
MSNTFLKHTTLQEQEETDREKLLSDIRSVTIYALSFSVAFGFNSLVTTIFDSFPNSSVTISKTTYVIFMFGVTLLVANWLTKPIK